MVDKSPSAYGWLVFGLGNPGIEYGLTRHNIGRMVIEYLATSGFTQKNILSTHKSKCDVGQVNIGNQKVVIAQSHSYMNLSGQNAKALADFYKVNAANLIVIHDEIDLPFNSMRIKVGGSDNGHNGLKSMTQHFGPEYYRVRLGVGRPPAPQDPADFVLRKFTSAEQKQLPDFIIRATSAIETLIEKGLERVQQDFND